MAQYPFDVATFNLINFSQKMPDLTDSTPKTVELPVMEENGNITTRQVQNLGAMKNDLQSVLNNAANSNTYSYYIDQANGADTNPGTSGAPFKSLKKAFQVIKPFSNVGITILGDYDTASDADNYSKRRLVGVNITIAPKGVLKIPFYQYNNYNMLTFAINPIFSSIILYLESSYGGKLEIGTEGYDDNLNNYNGSFINNENGFSSIITIIRNREDNNNMLNIGNNAYLINNQKSIFFNLDFAYPGTNRDCLIDGKLFNNNGTSQMRFYGSIPLKNSAGNTLTLKDVITGLQTDANGVPLNYQVFPTNALS